MTRDLLIATDVLVEHLRGRPGAVQFMAVLRRPPWISVITAAELWAGVASEDEARVLDGLLDAAQVISVDREIARLAGELRRKHGRRSRVRLPDALIAATAMLGRAVLVTYNRRHFPMVEDLLVPERD